MTTMVDEELARLKDKVQTYLDTLIVTLAHVNEKDIYLQGLFSGQITAYEKVMELINEMGGKDGGKWNTLKNVIMAMTSRTELVEDHFTGDQRWGFDECLSKIESIIERMEKEQK